MTCLQTAGPNTFATGPCQRAKGTAIRGGTCTPSAKSVAHSSWQSHVVNGNTLTHERVREYFRASHAVAARLGMLDVHVLTVEGQPSAFLYGYHHHGNVTALRTGFDASNDNGIGSALMLQAIQDSCNRGDRTIDLGPGEQELKRRLRTRTESTYRITYTPLDSWRSQAVRFTRWAKRRLARVPWRLQAERIKPKRLLDHVGEAHNYLASFSSTMIADMGRVKSRVESYATIFLPASANPATVYGDVYPPLSAPGSLHFLPPRLIRCQNTPDRWPIDVWNADCEEIGVGAHVN